MSNQVKEELPEELSQEWTEEMFNNVFNYCLKNIGSSKFMPESTFHDKITTVMKNLENKEFVIGCKYYKESFTKDKVPDPNTNTFVFTTFINPQYVCEYDPVIVRKIIMSENFRNKFTNEFVDYGKSGLKIIISNGIKKENGEYPKWVPKFVTKNPRNNIFIKVILKVPNNS